MQFFFQSDDDLLTRLELLESNNDFENDIDGIPDEVVKVPSTMLQPPPEAPVKEAVVPSLSIQPPDNVPSSPPSSISNQQVLYEPTPDVMILIATPGPDVELGGTLHTLADEIVPTTDQPGIVNEDEMLTTPPTLDEPVHSEGSGSFPSSFLGIADDGQEILAVPEDDDAAIKEPEPTEIPIVKQVAVAEDEISSTPHADESDVESATESGIVSWLEISTLQTPDNDESHPSTPSIPVQNEPAEESTESPAVVSHKILTTPSIAEELMAAPQTEGSLLDQENPTTPISTDPTTKEPTITSHPTTSTPPV